MAYLSLQDLTIRYPEMSVPVVKNISLELQAGEISCLLGPSGCGKTTVLRTIAGFVLPSRGRIDLAGRCIVHVDEKSKRSLISSVNSG